MNKNQMNDSIFEALFRQAVIDGYNEEIDSIPPREELAKLLSFSPGFELRMKRLFAAERGKNLIKKALIFGKRVAAVFVVASTLIFGALLFNPEVRAAVKNTVIEWYDKFTSFIFQSEISDTDENGEWYPEYLPVGYYEDSVEKFGRVTDIEYINGQGGRIRLSYSLRGTSVNISVDSENHIIGSETINGYEAYIIKAVNDDYENGVIWNMEGYTFSIWSKLPINELIKIAKSIK